MPIVIVTLKSGYCHNRSYLVFRYLNHRQTPRWRITNFRNDSCVRQLVYRQPEAKQNSKKIAITLNYAINISLASYRSVYARCLNASFAYSMWSTTCTMSPAAVPAIVDGGRTDIRMTLSLAVTRLTKAHLSARVAWTESTMQWAKKGHRVRIAIRLLQTKGRLYNRRVTNVPSRQTKKRRL